MYIQLVLVICTLTCNHWFSIEPKRVNAVCRYQLQYLSVVCNVTVCYVCTPPLNEPRAAAKRPPDRHNNQQHTGPAQTDKPTTTS